MEKFTQEVGGYPFLYADIFMTREEFEKMFDLTGIKNKNLYFFWAPLPKIFKILFQLTNKFERNTMQTEPFPIYTTKLNPKSMLWK